MVLLPVGPLLIVLLPEGALRGVMLLPQVALQLEMVLVAVRWPRK